MRKRKGLEAMPEKTITAVLCGTGEDLLEHWEKMIRIGSIEGMQDAAKAYYMHKNGVCDRNGNRIIHGCEICHFEVR